MKQDSLEPMEEAIEQFSATDFIGTLTSEQEDAFKDVLTFLNSTRRMHLLEGYAGTGKTYLVTGIIKCLLYDSDFTQEKLGKQWSANIALTAPTNKAVKVLRSSLPINHRSVIYRTIHSILGLTATITKAGEQVFKQTYDSAARIANYFNDLGLLIIDESSLLAEELLQDSNSIKEGIISTCTKFGVKILFVGDSAQIPPINKDYSLPFESNFQKKYSVQVSALTQIVRQAKGSPIIELATMVRKRLPSSVPIVRKLTTVTNPEDFTDSSNVIKSKGVQWWNDSLDLYTVIDKLFGSHSFMDNSDYGKIICYTNRARRAYNAIVRGIIYAHEEQDGKLSKILVNEKLLASKPVVGSDANIILFANEEFTVDSYTVIEKPVMGERFWVYRCKVTVDGEPLEKVADIIHEDSLEDYNLVTKHLNNIALKALRQREPSWKISKAWKDYYRFLENFARVRYNYAITAHTAQGSTYTNTIIDVGDISKNYKNSEKNRILYTAITRASDLCILTEASLY